MSSNPQMKRPLTGLIGGPWLLIIMAIVSIFSLIVALVRRKNRINYPPIPLAELDAKSLSGEWFEFAGYRKWNQKEQVSASYRFDVRDETNIKLTHEIRFGTVDGPSKKISKQLTVPDISEPSSFEMKAFPGRKIPIKVVYLSQEMGILVVTIGKCHKPHVLTKNWPINDDVFGELQKRILEEAAVDLKDLDRFEKPDEMD